MKVLMLNGSPHEKGCTYTALEQVGQALASQGVEYEILHMGPAPVRDCIGCKACVKLGRCAFKDNQVNEFVEKARQADGFVFGSPVYFAHPTGGVLSFLDRAFYSCKSAFFAKPGAAVVSARRGGCVSSYDVMNKYFGIANMPQVGSSYWNMVHGNVPEEVLQDLEGLQTMHNIGLNMAWLLKSIQAGKEAGVQAPQLETGHRTNFVR